MRRRAPPGHRLAVAAMAAGVLLAGAPAQAGVRVGGHPVSDVPFAPSPELRRPTPDDLLPPFWADGRPCSTGCRPVASAGWPLRPFHVQHPLRAALNERRTGSLHIGLDIQGRDGQPVFAIQSGIAAVPQPTGGDARVRVGAFEYWHLYPRVLPGQYVTAYRTSIGTIRRRYGHVHLSERAARPPGRYLNPLRPAGRVLAPWVDRAPPVIGEPEFRGDRVDVRAYDPQSFVRQTTYLTPVLAPAALAYRLFDANGRPIGPLRFALRGSQLQPFSLVSRIYAPDAAPAGFLCFADYPRCKPNWHYHLAGGLAPPLPILPAGEYRLSIYAWDWAGNATALDTPLDVG